MKYSCPLYSKVNFNIIKPLYVSIYRIKWWIEEQLKWHQKEEIYEIQNVRHSTKKHTSGMKKRRGEGSTIIDYET